MRHRSLIALLTASSAITGHATAATLPSHDPLNLLIVADEVNPHGLSNEELTQPQDLEAALTAADSGLSFASVQTVDSQCADDALTTLANAGADVVLYFAHRAAQRCDGSDGQVELTSQLEVGLQDGIGVVVLHHGLYVDLFR